MHEEEEKEKEKEAAAKDRKIIVFVVDHSACLFVQTFVNFIEL